MAVVNSWSEFIEANAADNTQEIEFDANAENKVIDFNIEAPQGLLTSIRHTGKIIGNGWVLKNIYALKNFLDCGSIDNLKFINFYNCGDSFLKLVGVDTSSGNRRSFTNCVFTGVTNSSLFFDVYKASAGSRPLLDYCSFNLICTANKFRLFSGLKYGNLEGYKPYVRNCDIRLKLPTGSISSDSLMKTAYIENSKFYFETNGDTIAINTDGYCKTSVFMGKRNSGVGIKSNSANLANIYSTTAFPNTVPDTDLIGCTDAQLTDAEYLSSIGFPIGVD